MDGVGALTDWPILQEIAVVLVVLVATVLVLVYGASGVLVKKAGAKDAFAAVILSDAQRRLVEKLALPEGYVEDTLDEPQGSLPEEAELQEAVASAEEPQSADDDGDAPDALVRQGSNSSLGSQSSSGRQVRRESSAAASAWKSAKSRVRDILGVGSPQQLAFNLDRYQQDNQEATGRTPLLVFVNRKSGGQRGDVLLNQLRAFLPPWQVWDIGAHAGPEAGLAFFRQVPSFRVLVAGGDGTAAWVLQTIDALKMTYQPPLAVLPVGTGNDLARVLGWGGGLSGGGYAGNGLARQLVDTAQGEIAMLDRWKVECAARGRGARKSGFKKSLVLNNYLGIGVDAQISLNFHENREASPHLFTSRFINKYVWYVTSGGKEILYQRFADFCTHVRLECDGRPVDLPPGTEGVIILNIRSYGGGVDLWGADDEDEDEDDDEVASSGRGGAGGSGGPRSPGRAEPGPARGERFRPASFSDGYLEVVSVASSFQLGAAQVGLARPRRLCQCRSVRIVANDLALPLQVDGEPFMLPRSANVSVSFLNQGVMLAKGNPRRRRLVPLEDVDLAISSALAVAQEDSLLSASQSRALHARLSQALHARHRVLSGDSFI